MSFVFCSDQTVMHPMGSLHPRCRAKAPKSFHPLSVYVCGRGLNLPLISLLSIATVGVVGFMDIGLWPMFDKREPGSVHLN